MRPGLTSSFAANLASEIAALCSALAKASACLLGLGGGVVFFGISAMLFIGQGNRDAQSYCKLSIALLGLRYGQANHSRDQCRRLAVGPLSIPWRASCVCLAVGHWPPTSSWSLVHPHRTSHWRRCNAP